MTTADRRPRCPAIATFFIACAAVCVPTSAQDLAPSAGDKAAIQATVQRYVDAREARDSKALQALLTSDADQLVSDGTWRRGRDELVRGMLESSQRTGGRRSISVASIRLLAPDVALADGRYRQTGQASGQDRELWTTIVLKRTASGWQIAAIRNMLPARPATSAKK